MNCNCVLLVILQNKKIKNEKLYFTALIAKFRKFNKKYVEVKNQNYK